MILRHVFDRHVHFSGALPEPFLKEVLNRVQNWQEPHAVLSSALEANGPSSLFERIRIAIGTNGRALNYEDFFDVYSIVNSACREARSLDRTFFTRGAAAICENLERDCVSGCELIIGIMQNLEVTLDRITQVTAGIAKRDAVGRVLLRLTLIRGPDGLIPESQLATWKALVEMDGFESLASDVVGFDISGRERADARAVAQFQSLCSIAERAADRIGRAFRNTIHLGECLTKLEHVPDDFYGLLLERARGWRVVHGIQFWHHTFGDSCPRIRNAVEARPIEFDICPSASQLIHSGRVKFSRLLNFCQQTGAFYSVCTDNPSLLNTNLHREEALFFRELAKSCQEALKIDPVLE